MAENERPLLTAAMDNVLAWRLADALSDADKAPAGDNIDRGLALRRALEEQGFGIVQLERNSPLFGGQRHSPPVSASGELCEDEGCPRYGSDHICISTSDDVREAHWAALDELVRLVEDECTGEVTENGDMREPDDEPVGWTGDASGSVPLPMTFGHIRRARAAISAMRAREDQNK